MAEANHTPVDISDELGTLCQKFGFDDKTFIKEFTLRPDEVEVTIYLRDPRTGAKYIDDTGQVVTRSGTHKVIS